ncbi:MAG: hypothetical protein HY646_20110, partial [Acidobacteria bacterium]|nr:hypothetical protein [Acidobacteriota bacterium]
GQLPGNGLIWQLSLLTRRAFPRIPTVVAPNTIQGRNILIAPENGSAIAVVQANTQLRLYDPLVDQFVLTRTGAFTGQLRGTVSASSDGNFFIIDNTVYNNVLVSQGTLVPTGLVAQQAAALGVAAGTTSVVRIQAGTPPQATVQRLQRINLATLQQEVQVTMPEQAMDITPAAVGNTTGPRQWPTRVTALELGPNNQTTLLPRGITLDNNNNAYVLTFSGLSIVSLLPSIGRTPTFTAAGVVNSPSRTGPAVSPGALITINGSNLADTERVTSTPLPQSLGGVCVTANEAAIPLIFTSPSRIDAQLPPNLPTGRVTLAVHSTRLGVSSSAVQIQVNPSSPSLYSLPLEGQQRAGIFHAADMMLVTPDYPAERDEHLVIYATGLGAANPQVPAGQVNPVSPSSVTVLPVSVTIGGVPYPVVSSVLAPGFVAVYQITVYVPGNRARGDNLPVVITAGGASSGVSNAPVTAVR